MNDFDDDLKDSVKVAVDMVEGMCDIILKGKILLKMAKISRKYYQELIRESFSSEEAIQIVANFNMGGKK